MRTEHLLSSRFSSSDESGCESDSSMKSGTKKVHFCGCKEEENCEKSKQGSDKKECRKRGKRSGFNALKIDRGDIPNGSDLFRQVLKEIQTESEDECQTPRSEDGNSKPLRSILKHKP